MVNFKGARSVQDIILPCVRWYVAYPLSYRQVEELMEERGVAVNHAMINRWVLKYVPQLEEAFHHRKRPSMGQPADGGDRYSGQRPVALFYALAA
jgi:putative transposase